jgi:hypothetical protein
MLYLVRERNAEARAEGKRLCCRFRPVLGGAQTGSSRRKRGD